MNSYSKYINYSTGWLEREDITADAFTYIELLGFVRHLQTTAKSKPTINHLLGKVHHYFNYLVAEGIGHRGSRLQPAAGTVHGRP